MARQGNKEDPLIELPNPNTKRAFCIALHVGADPAARDHLAVAVNPSDRMRTGRRAGRNQPSPCQKVDVELQALLQACSLSGSRHFKFHHLQIGNIPLSASSPSPVQGGQRHWREHFAAPYNLDAFYRWPAAPPPHDAVAAKGGFVVQVSPQPVPGQSGRRKPSFEVKCRRRHLRIFFWGPATPDDSSRLTEKRSRCLTVAAAAGTVVKPTCHLICARSAKAGRDLSLDTEELTKTEPAAASGSV
jgi:hypothetical protein